MIDVTNKKCFEVKCIMRTGSTLLSRLLDSHPRVLSLSETTPKKAVVDSDVLDSVTHVCGKRLFTGIQPMLTVSPNMNKEIILLRSPYTQLASLRTMRAKFVQPENEKNLTFAHGRRGRGPKPTHEGVVFNTALNCVNMYTAMLIEILRTKTPAYVVWYEELAADPIEVMNGVYAFLGLDPHEATLGLPSKMQAFGGDPTAVKSIELISIKEEDVRYRDVLDSIFGMDKIMAQYPKSGLLEQEYKSALTSKFTPLLEGE